jgi:hypothetical protein
MHFASAGGTLTHGESIEMSARMLLEIVAGQLTIEDFERNYRMKNTDIRSGSSSGRVV